VYNIAKIIGKRSYFQHLKLGVAASKKKLSPSKFLDGLPSKKDCRLWAERLCGVHRS